MQRWATTTNIANTQNAKWNKIFENSFAHVKEMEINDVHRKKKKKRAKKHALTKNKAFSFQSLHTKFNGFCSLWTDAFHFERMQLFEIVWIFRSYSVSKELCHLFLSGEIKGKYHKVSSVIESRFYTMALIIKLQVGLTFSSRLWDFVRFFLSETYFNLSSDRFSNFFKSFFITIIIFK